MENIKKIDGFLVKPKVGVLQEFRAYLAKDIDLLDVDYQIYVPSRFVLGNFKERKKDFIFNPRDIYYVELGEQQFIDYEKKFTEGKLDIVRPLSLPPSELENIAQQARVCRTAGFNIQELVTPLRKYF